MHDYWNNHDIDHGKYGFLDETEEHASAEANLREVEVLELYDGIIELMDATLTFQIFDEISVGLFCVYSLRSINVYVCLQLNLFRMID